MAEYVGALPQRSPGAYAPSAVRHMVRPQGRRESASARMRTATAPVDGTPTTEVHVAPPAPLESDTTRKFSPSLRFCQVSLPSIESQTRSFRLKPVHTQRYDVVVDGRSVSPTATRSLEPMSSSERFELHQSAIAEARNLKSRNPRPNTGYMLLGQRLHPKSKGDIDEAELIRLERMRLEQAPELYAGRGMLSLEQPRRSRVARLKAFGGDGRGRSDGHAAADAVFSDDSFADPPLSSLHASSLNASLRKASEPFSPASFSSSTTTTAALPIPSSSSTRRITRPSPSISATLPPLETAETDDLDSVQPAASRSSLPEPVRPSLALMPPKIRRRSSTLSIVSTDSAEAKRMSYTDFVADYEREPDVEDVRTYQIRELHNLVGPRQQTAFTDKFKEIDKDGDGFISIDELQAAMGGESSVDELRTLCDLLRFGTGEAGKEDRISMSEFVCVAALNDKISGRRTRTKEGMQQLNASILSEHVQTYKSLFLLADTECTGSVTMESLKMMLTAAFGVDLGLDDNLARLIMKTVDKDESGTIDFVEFMSYIPFFSRLHQQILNTPLPGGGRVEENTGETPLVNVVVKRQSVKSPRPSGAVAAVAKESE